MRYHYYTDGKSMVIATSTYAKKIVRGIAKCSPEDEFDLEKGKDLARARLDLKIAQKRAENADRRFKEAIELTEFAADYMHRMENYLKESTEVVFAEARHLAEVEEEFGVKTEKEE